jgi:signal transduction histidine kinase
MTNQLHTDSYDVLKTAFDMPSACIGVLNPQGKLVVINEAWKQFSQRYAFGLAQDGMGSDYVAACNASLIPGGRAALSGIKDVVTGRVDFFQMECSLTRDGMDDYWCQLDVTRSMQGEQHLVVISHYDITAQKLAQTLRLDDPRQALEETELSRERARLDREEQRELIRKQMIQRIAHEFRTPLATILTSMYLAERDANPEQLARFDTMRKQVDRLTRMLDDVTSVLRGEYIGLALHSKPVDVIRIVEDVVFAESITSGRVITYDVKLDTPLLELDGGLVDTILHNLVSNALKYSPEAAPVSVQVFQEDDFVVIEVSDKGAGIPEADLPHIFDSFYRGSNIEEKPGLGLGLALVQTAVKAHQGSINVFSQAGVGTTIRATLCINPEGC